MRSPNYDVLIPMLFVGLIFPAAAGGWWRFLSGYADETSNPTVYSQAAEPGSNEEARTQHSVPVARPITVRTAPEPGSQDLPDEALLNVSIVNDELNDD